MASTPFLLAAIVIVLLALLALRVLAWQVVARSVAWAPTLGPRLTGSRLWLRAAPLRARASARFPRLSAGLAARFDPRQFTGLPLTLVVVACLYVIAMLDGLVDLVRSNAGSVRLDEQVNAFFTPYRAGWLLKAMLWITKIGAGPSLAAILCAATALLWSSGRARAIPPLWIAFLGAQATTWSSKYLIARPRPEFLPHITEWNPSFPSGHATAATALIGMLGTVVASGAPGLRARFEAGFWTAVIVMLICFSRLFLGVHFFTDVTAGVLVGIFWLLVGYTVAALRAPRRTG